MAAVGAAVIDFGSFPGTTETSVAVTGQTGILSTHSAEAWIMAEATADHTLVDHTYIPLFVALSCSVPTDGVGFTIYARAADQMQGTYNVRWAWA